MLGAAFLIPALIISEIVAAPQHRGHLGLGTVFGMLALGVLSTGFAYILNFQVIDAAGSSTATGVAYLSPIAVVIVGTLFLGEHLYWYEPVGAVIVLLGVTIAQGRLRRFRQRVVASRVRPEQRVLVKDYVMQKHVNRGAIDNRPRPPEGPDRCPDWSKRRRQDVTTRSARRRHRRLGTGRKG